MRTVLAAAYEMMTGMVEVSEGVEERLERIFTLCPLKDPDMLEYAEFKEFVQQDPKILQGLLIYDGLI